MGAIRRTAAHPPQLVGEGPPPAAVLAYRAQEPDELSGLLPVRSSLAVAPPRALLVHGGQHLTDVRGQQVVHLVALQLSWKHTDTTGMTTVNTSKSDLAEYNSYYFLLICWSVSVAAPYQ